MYILSAKEGKIVLPAATMFRGSLLNLMFCWLDECKREFEANTDLEYKILVCA
jgi:hypothetical protein